MKRETEFADPLGRTQFDLKFLDFVIEIFNRVLILEGSSRNGFVGEREPVVSRTRIDGRLQIPALSDEMESKLLLD
jgi:hypothetical protein